MIKKVPNVDSNTLEIDLYYKHLSLLKFEESKPEKSLVNAVTNLSGEDRF